MRLRAHHAACLLFALVCGCASRQRHQAEVATAHQAGVDEAFEMMLESGIRVVRMEGPFLRQVIPWHDGLTLAQSLIEAGYQPAGAPTRIILRDRIEVKQVEAARLLEGEDMALTPGTTVHVFP
jgi:membrane-bound lytic murein transglycosylase B